MNATPENFLSYWNFTEINDKPISWYQEHSDFDGFEHLFAEKSNIDLDVFALWEHVNDPEAFTFLMYVSAHAFSLQEKDELDKEDASMEILRLLEDHIEPFCDFFLEQTPQKKNALNNIVYFLSWYFTIEDEWEDMLNNQKEETFKNSHKLNHNQITFLNDFFKKVQDGCFKQL